MELSCLPVSFFPEILDGRMTVADWARLGAEVGLDAIDLSILFVPDRSLAAAAALRRDIDAAGVRLAMLTTYPDFTHPDPRQREPELRLAQHSVDVAATLGAALVRVTDGQAHPQTNREQGVAWAVEGLTPLVESTQGKGVTLAFENHAKPMAWEHTDFSQSPEVFLEIVARTADIGLGVNFDTGNATAFADDPMALLEAVLPRVVSVHAADTARRGALQMVLLGTGVTPFAALFRQLKRAGFDGWICMEEGSGLGREGIAAAARFVREAWSNARGAQGGQPTHGT